MFIHTASNGSRKSYLNSLSGFVAEHELSHVFDSDAYDIKGLETTAMVFPVSSACDLDNGPVVVTISPCATGLSVTPVYGLHEDVWEALMSGAIP